MKIRVLIIDDDELLVYSIRRVLEEDGDLEVEHRHNGEDGLRLFAEKAHHIVITDLVMDGCDGLAVLERIHARRPETVLIMITGQGSERISAEALAKGAYDYFSKPFNLTEFYKTIRNAKEHIALVLSNRELAEAAVRKNRFHNLQYASESMARIVDIIRHISGIDVSVLVLGESGTGKELVAECIHHESSRRDKPFIRINCGAIPANLLESEFFGHEKGAFTGAVRAKKGKLELADGGTVFLDEIGDLPVDMQVKILRFLEDGTIDRIGGLAPVKVDARIIAATNVDLENAVREKKFRLDLYYRLDGLKIEIPPLRDRKEDIVFISERLVEEYGEKFGLGAKEIPEAVKVEFLKYAWPGNVRELKNVVQHMFIFSQGPALQFNTLPGQFAVPAHAPPSTPDGIDPVVDSFNRKLALRQFDDLMERQYIAHALQRIGNKTQTAVFLGISRKSLHEKIKAFDIR